MTMLGGSWFRWDPYSAAAMSSGGLSPPQPKIAELAAIWPPFDPTSGVIQNPVPAPEGEIETLERQGFVVVTAIENHLPYTHVISTGNHDYLAKLVFETTGEGV
jgi:hypothetical protein